MAALSTMIKGLREKLWFKPLVYSIIYTSIILTCNYLGILLEPLNFLTISTTTISPLLNIFTGSMMVISTMAVTSMISAYKYASNSATPRSLPLVIADDSSQKALSTFIGAFIFGVVGVIVNENHFLTEQGALALLLIAIMTFGFVIYTFIKWVDDIARLGGVETTINKVEEATITAMEKFLNRTQQYSTVHKFKSSGLNIHAANDIGYVIDVNFEKLARLAEENELVIQLHIMPGSYVGPDRRLVTVYGLRLMAIPIQLSHKIFSLIQLYKQRKYNFDPRFGLVTLSEISSKALSPAVNDLGTVIQVFASFIRIFDKYSKLFSNTRIDEPNPWLCIQKLSEEDLFDDAFLSLPSTALPPEVSIRFRKTLQAIKASNSAQYGKPVKRYSTIHMENMNQPSHVKKMLQKIEI